jgi:hypothetical protein
VQSGEALLAAQRVLYSSNGILHFSCDLIGLSFTLELGIAGDFSSNFFNFAFDLFGRTFDAVFVQEKSPLVSCGKQLVSTKVLLARVTTR